MNTKDWRRQDLSLHYLAKGERVSTLWSFLHPNWSHADAMTYKFSKLSYVFCLYSVCSTDFLL